MPVTTYGTGSASYIILHTESAYGTPYTSTAFKRLNSLVSFSPAPDNSFIESGAITAGGSRAAIIPGAISWRGALNTEAGYTELDQLLYGMLGTCTESTPTGATTMRDHWYECAATPPSFTVMASYGDVPAGKMFTFTGVYIEQLELSFTAPGFLIANATVVPWKEVSVSGGDTAISPDVTYTHKPITTYQMTAWDLGTGAATDYCVKSGRITMKRPIENNRACVGQVTVKQPVIASMFDVDGEFEIEFGDRLIYEAFLAQTVQTGASAGSFIFVGDTVEATIKNTLEIVLPRYYYTGPSTPTIDGMGVITQRIGFRGYGTGGSAATTSADSTSTKEPICIRTRNTNTKASL